jgi:hypothetical protein
MPAPDVAISAKWFHISLIAAELHQIVTIRLQG